MKIVTKLTFAAALPCLALLGFAASDVYRGFSVSAEARQVLSITSLAAPIGSLVHELQKERGMSVGFVSSKGQNFADTLPTQQQATSGSLTAFHTSGANSTVSHKGFAEAIDAARRDLDTLTELRRKIVAFQVGGGDVAAAYTRLINSLLTALDLLPSVTSDGGVARAAVAFTAVTRAKEFAGQERANGARAFTAGVAPDDLALLSGLEMRQAERLQVARQVAGSDGQETLRRFEASPENSGVASFRTKLRESLKAGESIAVDPKAWFEAATVRIDSMRDVENAFGAALQRQSEQIKAASERDVLYSVSLSSGLLLVTLAIFALLSRNLAGLIRTLSGQMRRLAAGELSVDVSGIKRSDEIGEMAASVQVFKENMVQAEDLRSQQAAVKERAEVERKAAVQKLAGEFELTVGRIVDTVSTSSSELETSANSLAATAERTQHLTVSVGAASEQASANVQSVASAAEQMSSSVNEISRQVQESARIAGEAVGQVEVTNERVSELSAAAAKISDVVALINTIAGQTNLLALNATIEAARAGDAGRGFAVVASEVKALAEQTAKATEDISQQIGSIQTATTQSVGAIAAITGTINRMSEIASTIASAVEEQGVATQEISRNVQQAAQGTMQVSSNVAVVQQGASETGSASTQVLSSAQSLAQDSSRLKIEVGKFLNSVRAA
ncbi:MAG: methyl-accepting chemotaxis protein [Rhodopseudomonas palustris]|nr:MAG: methyl-accepting chemotaxis protein [Rhodopseudomonas palustris]